MTSPTNRPDDIVTAATALIEAVDLLISEPWPAPDGRENLMVRVCSIMLETAKDDGAALAAEVLLRSAGKLIEVLATAVDETYFNRLCEVYAPYVPLETYTLDHEPVAAGVDAVFRVLHFGGMLTALHEVAYALTHDPIPLLATVRKTCQLTRDEATLHKLEFMVDDADRLVAARPVPVGSPATASSQSG